MAGESAAILRMLYAIQAQLGQSGGISGAEQKRIDKIVKFAEDNLTRKSGEGHDDEYSSLSHIYQKRNRFDVNITAIGGLVGAAVRMGSQLVGGAYANLQQYGGYSAQGIQARMFERLNDLFRNVRISHATAGSMTEFAVAHTRLKNAWEPFQAFGANAVNKLGAGVANKAADAINEITHPMTPDLLRSVSPRLARRLAIMNQTRDLLDENIKGVIGKKDRVGMRDEDPAVIKQREEMLRKLNDFRLKAIEDREKSMPDFRRAAELARKRIEASKLVHPGDLSRSILEFAFPGGTEAMPGMARHLTPGERIDAGRARVEGRRAAGAFRRDTRRMERIMRRPGLGGAVPRSTTSPIPFADPRGAAWERARLLARRQSHADSRKTTAAQQLAAMKKRVADEMKAKEDSRRERINDYKDAMEKQSRMQAIEDKERIRKEFDRQAVALVRKNDRTGQGRESLMVDPLTGKWVQNLMELSADEKRQFVEWVRQTQRIADEIEKLRKSLRDDFNADRDSRAARGMGMAVGAMGAAVLFGRRPGTP